MYSINMKNQTSESQWSVRKRYSEFAELDKKIRTAHPGAHATSLKGRLPAKTLFGKLERGVVEERRLGLEVYLNLCIKVLPPSVNAVLCAFIEMPRSTSAASAFAGPTRVGADGSVVAAGAPGARDAMPTVEMLDPANPIITLGAAAETFPAYRQSMSVR